jgi:hypothetical protein
MVPFTRMMIGVLTLARVHSAVLSCVPVLTVTVAPPAPPVVDRPKPIGVPDGVEGGVPFTVMVCARVDCVPQLLVCVAVAVQDAVGLTVCVREEPEVPQPDQDQLPPEDGNGAKATDAPELMVALAVWVPLMTAVMFVAGQEGELVTVIA